MDAKALVNLAIQKKISFCSAESCTGGLIASLITQIPFASKCFLGSVVAYSNQSKELFLKIPCEEIQHYGAVSEHVAKLMAQNSAELLQADCAVSSTGFAGPTGQNIGLVYLGVFAFGKISVHKHHFTGSRTSIIKQSSEAALAFLEQEFLSFKP